MKIHEIIREGGWDTVATQNTVITPSLVKAGISAMERFVAGFNKFLGSKGIGLVSIGTPTGSSAYHNVDPEETEYGDIDLQIIVPELPELEGKTHAQVQTFWHNLAGEFVAAHPNVAHEESKPGHPVLPVGNDKFVQVDMMIHTQPMAKWGAARTIPERGVKGMLHGNMFSVFGEMLTMSIQHSGVQFKVRDQVRQPYSTTRKNYELVTISTDPETFVLDTFMHEASSLGIRNPKIAPLLKQFPGKDLANVKISNLANAIKGFAQSCEMNKMFGHGDLSAFSSANDFIQDFIQRYEAKAVKDVESNKRDKAATPAAVARADMDKKKILGGLEMVKGLFQ